MKDSNTTYIKYLCVICSLLLVLLGFIAGLLIYTHIDSKDNKSYTPESYAKYLYINKQQCDYKEYQI